MERQRQPRYRALWPLGKRKIVHQEYGDRRASRIGFELMLHSFPEGSIHDGRLFARINHPFMGDLTYI